jgi:hypothetical protein
LFELFKCCTDLEDWSKFLDQSNTVSFALLQEFSAALI